jgi:26S proteasome regulatory subunit N9
LLQATERSNIQLCRQYQQEYATQIAEQPALVHRAAAITEKLTLLALMTLVFSKPSHERQLSFTEIAQAFLLLPDDNDQVEWIVM